MKIGILSDTHNYLDPAIEELFRDVDHILHAGDVGMPWILLQLEQIAPVTAVSGNTDTGLHLRDTEVSTLDQRDFLVQHIVNPLAPAEPLRKRMAKIRPAAVVFGHTHEVFEQTLGGILFINPGYAGRPKFSQPRTVAILHTDARSMHLEILPLR